VAFSLSLLALYCQLRFLKARNRRLFIIQILLGSLAFVNHPPTGIFLFICSGLLYIERGVAVRVAAGYFLATAAAALLLTALWPFNDFFSNLFTIASGTMADTLDYRLTRQYLFDKPLLRSGPAVMGIPLMLLFALQRRCSLLTGALSFSAVHISWVTFSKSASPSDSFSTSSACCSSLSHAHAGNGFPVLIPAAHQALKPQQHGFSSCCLLPEPQFRAYWFTASLSCLLSPFRPIGPS